MELKTTMLDDLAAVIGFSATLRLAAWFGDRGNVYIPKSCKDGQLLVRLIGMPAAKLLTEKWGNEHLNIPRLGAYDDDLRRRQVGRMIEHNMRTNEIANHMRMSERRVQQIVRELEATGLIQILAPKTPAKNTPGDDAGKNAGKSAPQNTPIELPAQFFGSAKTKGKRRAGDTTGK